MLGQSITMLIPEVVGFELKGKPAAGCTATDIVLTVVKMLREKGVVGKFVEFFGEGLSSLSLADRATLSNMAPEYGATCGYFPVDSELLSYLDLTGRSREQIELVEKYAKAQGLWRESGIQSDYSDTLTLDLSTVVPALAGPRRPQDLVELTKVPQNFRESLKTVYNVKNQNAEAALEGIKGAENKKLTHGDIAIASISSCTNTSNPAVLVAAALLAKKALEKGIKTKPWVKTSFTPGSQVVAEYLKEAGLLKALEDQGFSIAGFGCATCIGNSGPLPEPVKNAIYKENLVTVNVLSGNRNFEGRVSPDSKASYLASPPLVVAYALSGSILTDWENEPVGTDKNGSNVYLKDIWPSAEEINNISADFVRKDLFSKAYSNVFEGSENWQKLDAPESEIYDWEEKSTYIRRPPFFDNFMQIKPPQEISSAAILAIMPDSTTTDHISPAGTIPPESPAGKYLKENGVEPEDFNSYGSRRGNHEVMMRGTFANIRIKNRMIPGTEGGYTLDPEGSIVPIFDAAEAWKKKGRSTVVIAGKEYGTGSSRDWAAKGPMLQGVKAVIAESFERIHRSNLIGMGILPLEFTGSDSAVALELTGKEEITIKNLNDMQPGGAVSALIKYSNGIEKEIKLLCRIDTPVEMEYWRSGGILNFVLKNMVNE
jgi:aconitate hydratase